MTLSKSILKFLKWLEENGQSFDPEYFVDMIGGPDGEYLQEFRAENPEGHEHLIQIQKFLKKAASEVVNSKWQPAGSSIHNLEELLNTLSKKSDDDPLDEYLTTVALEQISGAVGRLKKLRANALWEESWTKHHELLQAGCRVLRVWSPRRSGSAFAFRVGVRSTGGPRGKPPGAKQIKWPWGGFH